jgi:hypothetical protein
MRSVPLLCSHTHLGRFGAGGLGEHPGYPGQHADRNRVSQTVFRPLRGGGEELVRVAGAHQPPVQPDMIAPAGPRATVADLFSRQPPGARLRPP